jgi:hypothetical protein
MAMEYKPKGKNVIGQPKRSWRVQQHLQNWISTGHDPVVLYVLVPDNIDDDGDEKYCSSYHLTILPSWERYSILEKYIKIM